MTRYAIRFAEDSARIAKEEFAEGLEIEGRVYERLGRVLQRYRILICPGFGSPAIEAGEDYVDRGPVVNGVERSDWYEVLTTVPFNLASRCPVMSVPSGSSREGVPTGVQIVGRTYDDVSVFRAAAAYERVRPDLFIPNRRPPVP